MSALSHALDEQTAAKERIIYYQYRSPNIYPPFTQKNVKMTNRSVAGITTKSGICEASC
jgi:hypothetical protein